jgi:hypothetical protein
MWTRTRWPRSSRDRIRPIITEEKGEDDDH